MTGALVLPDLWWSIDPGDSNVGLTRWEADRPIKSEHTNPDDCVDMLVAAAGSRRLGLVVYERFQLYGDKVGPQLGSEFLTAQMIGAIRHICRRAGVPTANYLAGHHKKLYQMKEFKPPVKSLHSWMSYGSGPHAKDSECLGYYHIRAVKPKSWGR